MTTTPRYWIWRSTWDLYTKADDDADRHRQRVREAIRKNLVDLVTEESIVLSDGRRVVRVPLTSLEEPRFRFRSDEESGQRAGGGSAGSGGFGAASGHEGGQAPGLLDFTETEITLDTADALLFDGWELPDLDRDRRAPGGAGGVTWRDWAAVGPRRNVVPRASLLRALRHAEPPGPVMFRPGDLRFRRFDTDDGEDTGAVVVAMMDTSGSMGTFEKYLARSFFFWTIRFLRTRYPRVEVVFLAHDVRAREVDEETFFHRGASGGTVSSSVYQLALEVLERFPADRYNAYAFHFTDGGNLTSDNPLALERGSRLADRVNLFGYGEIHDTARNVSPLYSGFAGLDRARAVLLRSKDDVFGALATFFGAGEAHG
jgi:sporulation protein YhbH